MNYLEKLKLNIPLRMKFIAIIFLLITIPFTISGIFTYHKYSINVEKSTTSYTKQIIEQIELNFDLFIKDMKGLTILPLFDEAIMKILKNHEIKKNDEAYLNTEEELKMVAFLSPMLSDRPEIESILIFLNDGLLVSNSLTTINNKWGEEELLWMDMPENNGGEFLILPVHKVEYYSSSKKVVSFIRIIREPYTLKKLGIIKIDMTSEGFEKILSTGNFSENGKYYISNKEGKAIFPFTDSSLPVLAGKTISLEGKEYLYSVTDSENTKLRFTGLVLLDDLKKDARELISYTVLISIISLVIAFFLSIFLSDKLVKPIKRLQKKMKQFREGDFNVSIKVTTNDEIGSLTESFNKMVQEINRLVKEVYEVRLRQREAELIALQSQINPHFMYNTLETISMIALSRSCIDLSDVVINLGKLLRYTVQKSEKTVYLNDEILFVQAYLCVQSFRWGDRLNSEIYIDTSFETCLVPKLILQPFLENAIEHGMGSETLTILLRAEVNEDNLFIYIQDDGIGMNDETIRKVEERIYSEKLLDSQDEKEVFGKVNKGFAMRNVHQRLSLLYGKPYGVYVDKNCEKGSLFYIRLPFQLEDLKDA